MGSEMCIRDRAKDSSVDWKIVTSRRTPDAAIQEIQRQLPDVDIVLPADVPAGWLAKTLPACEQVWVSQDSVSMLYEALTSGSRVGVLELERVKSNRVTECADDLVYSGRVMLWSEWKDAGALPEPTSDFCEADRSARWLLKQLAQKQLDDENGRQAA